MITPPFYPARPVNGGPLPKTLPKSGDWTLEGKYNDWRAWVHNPLAQCSTASSNR
jgi:hypothetical protein